MVRTSRTKVTTHFPAYRSFDKDSYLWRPDLDYRTQPEAYRVGKGEQGVLICEPYKSELAPLWRFKTLEIARESSEAIYGMFEAYLDAGDFVGADLARKFLQMGYTRARRYANYKGGRKFDEQTGEMKPRGTGDPGKARSASVFYKIWKRAEAEPRYAAWKKEWKARLG